MQDTIDILIADDHTMFVNGLSMLLGRHRKFRVCATVSNGTEVLAFLRTNTADVILMDINMPLLNGYETTLVLHKQYPDIPVIALSMLADSTSVRKMLEAGVRGYIFKNADERELMDAIETVAGGGYYVTDEMTPVWNEFVIWQKDMQKGYVHMETNPLSAREVEILKLIMTGSTNMEIAARLFLSNRTVDTHRKNILSKLELKNTAALVRYAMENKAFLGLDGMDN